MRNHENPSHPAAWTACAPGTLQELTRRLRTTRQRETARRIAAPLVVLALLAAGAWTTSQALWRSEAYYGGISCHEVQANLKLFTTGQLPDALNQRITAHLRECPWCQSRLRAAHQQLPDEVGTAPRSDPSMPILASMKSVS